MRKYAYAQILLVLLSLNSYSQNIDAWFETQKPVDFQKLYLHIDREFFFEGDTLWFAAYLVEGKSHVLTDENCNLYIDIINNKGEFVQNELFLIQDGCGSGCFGLDREYVKEGNYVLRAYTDYLQNFGNDAFFNKKIRVSSIKSSFEIEAEFKNDKPVKQKIDVQFLPEGGFLLAGQSNCVAFKAVDENGKGADVTGKLFDSQDNEVLTFNSVYKGAGKIFFVPKVGEKYTARINEKPGNPIKLPAVVNGGAKIKLVNQDDNSLQLMVQADGVSNEQNLQLTCLHRGEARFFMNITHEHLNKPLRVKTTQLGSGINRFVLLDKNLNPVSERMVFQNNVEMNRLEVGIGEESYSTRDEIQLNIMPSELLENELAQVSVAVVDENYINALGGTENIASYLLANSDLKGNIESPSSYFVSGDGLSTQSKLDLLMCTNGWSNYTWNSLLPGNMSFEHQPRFGFDFTGKVKRAIGKAMCFLW